MARPAACEAACRRPPSQSDWRSLKSSEFAAALAAPALAKTSHFVLHHIAATPCAASQRPEGAVASKLSTFGAPSRTLSVDNIGSDEQWWLGFVIPKRHARRAVTRNLLKRQMRLQAEGCRHRLPSGQWLIRLRAPFDKPQFVSAASARLREAARSELQQVFATTWVE